MSSKHYGWQARWEVDVDGLLAKHRQHGLVVAFTPNGRDIAAEVVNEAETIIALTPKHGHNAPAMIARMRREAEQLMREAMRGNERSRAKLPPPTRV